LWAALDCPGGWCFDGAHVKFVPVLVSQSVDVVRSVHAGDEVIIVAWKAGRGGRTLRACTAVLDLEGEPIAVCKQTCVAAPLNWAK
jgi:acyl-CoA thioesterase FadM